MRALSVLHRLAQRRLGEIGAPAGEERGFVLIIAIVILLVITLAIAAISTAAVDVNGQSTRQGQAELADAAADSGAQVALYRLNTTGTTAAGTGPMAHGASYSYTVTALTQTSACAGLWVENTSSTLVQDCITATGTDGSVSERVEMRVVGYAVTATSSLFPVNGVFAINGFSAADAVGGTFDLGSNGQLTFTNTISLTGTITYPKGKFSETNNACKNTCTPVQETSAIALPAGPSGSAYTAALTSNNDSAISWGSQFTVNSTKDTVTSNGSNNATINFPAGTYYYCNLSLGNNTTIKTTSWPVKIYIDSSYDGSDCSGVSPNGQMSGSNGFALTNSSGTASNVQLYFYGQPGCTSSCPNDFSPNGTVMTADVYAPDSSSTPGNAFTMIGALVIGSMTANNGFTFTYQLPSASGGGGSGSGSNATFYPQAHQDCIASSSSSC